MPPISQHPRPRQEAGGTSVGGALPLGCSSVSLSASLSLSIPICNVGKRYAASLMSCWVHRFLMIGLTLEFKSRAEGRGLNLWAVGGTEGAGSRAVYWLGLSFVEVGQGAGQRFS